MSERGTGQVEPGEGPAGGLPIVGRQAITKRQLRCQRAGDPCQFVQCGLECRHVAGGIGVAAQAKRQIDQKQECFGRRVGDGPRLVAAFDQGSHQVPGQEKLQQRGVGKLETIHAGPHHEGGRAQVLGEQFKCRPVAPVEALHFG